MTGAPAVLEQRLLYAYTEQLRHYERALAVVDHAAQPSELMSSSDWVHDLNAILEKITALNAGMADDKRAWRQLRQAPGKELKALLELLAQRIRQLGAGVDRHVAQVRARQQQLLPDIDNFIRQRRMLQAYGKHAS